MISHGQVLANAGNISMSIIYVLMVCSTVYHGCVTFNDRFATREQCVAAASRMIWAQTATCKAIRVFSDSEFDR
jgi:hypothetical protein